METSQEGVYYEKYTPKFNVYRIDYNPFGLSYTQWLKKWWLWISSISDNYHPMLDKTGQSTSQSQNFGDMFFLAGASDGFYVDSDCSFFYSKGGKATRRCTVTNNKAILIPILFSQHDTTEDNSGNAIGETLVEEAINGLVDTNISLTIDEVPFDGKGAPSLCEFKICTDSFNASYDNHSPFLVQKNRDPSRQFRTVIAAYLVILAPLSLGEHTINFEVDSRGHPDKKRDNPALHEKVEYLLTVVQKSS